MKYLMKKIAALFCLMMVLVGCGGDEPQEFKNELPQVIIEADENVEEETHKTIFAKAQDSDGEVISYLWSQASGPEVTLIDKTSSTLSFVAPSVLVATEIVFTVVVTDNDGGSKTVEVTLNVVPAPSKLELFVEDAIKLNVATTMMVGAITGYEEIFNNAVIRWDINSDGQYEQDWASSAEFTYTFIENGEYIITVDVKDAQGKVVSIEKLIKVADFSTVDLTENLLGHLSFENSLASLTATQNKTLTDFQPTWGGTANYTEGKQGRAAYFNGLDAYINLLTAERNGDFYLNYSKSITFWASIEEVINKTNLLAAYDFDIDHLPNAMYLFRLRDAGDGLAYTETWKNGSDSKLYVEGLTVNKWNHFAIIMDADSNEVAVYLNGILAGKDSLQPGNTELLAVPLTLGARSVVSYNGQYDGFFKGSIDELRIYQEAISSEKLLAIIETESGEVLSKAPIIDYVDTLTAISESEVTLEPIITPIVGEIVSYKWDVSNSSVVAENLSSKSLTLKLPNVSQETSVTITLTVTDTLDNSSTHTITMLITPAEPTATLDDSLIAQFSFNGNLLDSQNNVTVDSLNSDVVINKEKELWFDPSKNHHLVITSPEATDAATSVIYADVSKSFSLWFWAMDFTTGEEHILSTGNYSLLRQKLKESSKVDDIRSNGPGFISTLLTRPDDETHWPAKGQWHHFVLVLDRETGQANVFLDNSLVDSVAMTDASLELAPLVLGAQPWSGEYYNGFYGSIDELRIYSKALSVDEVATVYSQAR